MNDNKNNHLKYLNNLKDFKVAKDNPDVRGWSLTDADDNNIGKIENFLVDIDAEAVRYLEVSLFPEHKDAVDTKNAAKETEEPHTIRSGKEGVRLIVPIGLARINKDKHTVKTDRISTENYKNLPVLFEGEMPSQEFERDVVDKFNGNQDNLNRGTDDSQTYTVFYHQDCFDQECFFEKDQRS